MKMLRIAALSIVALGLVVSGAFAAGDPAKGKALFIDPKFAGGSKACNECHNGGKGIEKAGDKKEFHIMSKTQKSLEEAVNTCIVNANKGKSIDVKYKEMVDMVAYIKSLKSEKKPTAGY